ncbi:MAG: glycosyltransferase family 1 protein [Sphingobium sp.]
MMTITSSPGPAIASAVPDDAFRDLNGIKVALFTGNYNYIKEGANQALNKLVHHLEQRVGATVRVYSPVTDTPAFPPEGTLVPVRSVALPGRPEFRLALGLPKSARQDIRSFAPDIVHVATPDWLCTRAQGFAKTLGVPVVASLHTSFETYCDYYGLGALRPLVERHLDRFYGRSDMILVPTPAIANAMRPSHDADKLRIWGRGVDADLFDPARRSIAWRQAHGLRPDEIALAFFGRLVLEKGTVRFAEIVDALRQKNLPVRPVLIGEGPARGQLHEALPDAIFTGHLAGVDLATAVASSDILINPSLTETFGNVTLEAMAAGLAVVAADVASSTNLISDGRDGMISANDAASFAGHVVRLVTDDDLRGKLGCAARETALKWRWNHILDTVLESYAITLARRRPDAASIGTA